MFFIKPISKENVSFGDYFIIETTKYGNRYYQTDSTWNIQEHYVNQWVPSFKTIDLANKNYSVYLILPTRILAENMKWLIRRPNMHVIVCE